MPHFYAGDQHFIMKSLVSREHNTPALCLQDESSGLVPAG
nr:ATPase [Escherichia coli]